ncbi:glycerol-1-phosphate dehydrogenase [NAD(P)+] [Evansella caseinilytica]|uniref:Glycerol-1-phosphate dehydrogenase [NAD(P)+] n=1 Tax=Evansella caseinilytica TaxID=1503961 RepID=A0A1H3RCZ9_9BACI|nr:sn-glycerol-1-phosphate dehydrogenase [Evansella caseinilytica]SDZ23526.1 glycerol-1-phosphate dehydrogenase [NAD(P)+] [Evansella caseinilytica]
MLSFQKKLAERIPSCDCGMEHREITIEKIEISKEALQAAAAYLVSRGFEHVVLVADDNTYRAAGEKLFSLLKDVLLQTKVVLLQPNEAGDVIADERSIVQLLLKVPQETQVVLAVGSGTIHDISRAVSFKMGKPFVSVPTAPSVDGFNSMGAPLVIAGMKTTYQMQAPLAVFADLDVLQAAPRQMIAAGFGDMIGKATSLADWRFGHLAAGEPYCPLAAEITEEALTFCIDNVDNIAAGDETGIQLLMEALINSGIAMLLIGHSHPASGGEHHVSHYWEMDFLRNNKPQVLHGAKVGVACGLIADLYKKKVRPSIAGDGELENMVSLLQPTGKAEAAGHEQGDGGAKSAVDNNGEAGNDERIAASLNAIAVDRASILDIIDRIPDGDTIRGWLEKVGGETEPEQLGIEAEVVAAALTEAHHIRSNRFTFLQFYNEVLCKNEER